MLLESGIHRRLLTELMPHPQWLGVSTKKRGNGVGSVIVAGSLGKAGSRRWTWGGCNDARRNIGMVVVVSTARIGRRNFKIQNRVSLPVADVEGLEVAMIPNCENFYVSPCERAFPRHSFITLAPSVGDYRSGKRSRSRKPSLSDICDSQPWHRESTISTISPITQLGERGRGFPYPPLFTRSRLSNQFKNSRRVVGEWGRAIPISTRHHEKTTLTLRCTDDAGLLINL